MRALSHFIFIVLAVLLAAFIGTLAYFTYSPQTIGGGRTPEASKTRPPAIPPLSRPFLSSSDPVRGNPEAPLTIVEFGDFLCAACAQMEPVLNNILAVYAGKVNLVWKDLPNTVRHPLAQKAAQAARCAQQQGAFWQYHDLLLNRQENVAQSFSSDIRPEGLSYFVQIAQELQLNPEQFSQCLASGGTTSFLERNFNEALLLRVDATPYFFIGTKRISGAVNEIVLKEAIKEYAN